VIVVRQPGLLTTVQDLGRPGWAHLGVPLAGAVDRAALRAANRIVGNASGAAVLETTLAGPELHFEVDAMVAVTGGRCAVTVGGQVVDPGVAVTVRRGRTVTAGPVSRGVRSYLAVRGGVDVPAVLGSRSTCTLSGLGPAPLAAGDRLAIAAQVAGAVADELLPEIVDEPVLQLLPGPRDDAFPADALSTLKSCSYTVSASSDRSGVRLEGAVLQRLCDVELPSEGVVPGAVQVPPDGQPIVFLANCPTTGGYPVIGVVRPEDLAHAAQARPGTRLRFTLA
jgi:biotin-dependent carboxylase-like uncharacterized protein